MMIAYGIIIGVLIVVLGIAAQSVLLFASGLLGVGVLLTVVFLKHIEASAMIEAQRYAQQRRRQDALAAMDRLPLDEFAARIAEALRRENNQVHIDTDGPEARLLHVTNRAGTAILVMVKKTTTHIELSEVQRLHRLAAQQGVKLAYMFTNEGFTPEARQFATGKAIYLADENAINRFVSQTGVIWK